MLPNLFAAVLDNISFWNFSFTFILGWMVYRWASHKWFNLPPGPFGFPIIGSIPYMKLHAEKLFASWMKAYGPVIYVDLAATRMVVLNTYEAIEEVRTLCNCVFHISELEMW